MKKIFRMALVFALAGATLMYTGCSKDYSEDINRLDKDVSALGSELGTKYQDLLNQLNSAKTSLEAAYKAADKDLSDSFNTRINGIQNDINGINAALAKKADKADVDAAISQLQEDLDKELAELRSDLEAAAENLQKTADGLKKEVQEKLDEFYAKISNELRSLVFVPDFYYEGIEATAYSQAYFPVYKLKALANADEENGFPKGAKIGGDDNIDTKVSKLQDKDPNYKYDATDSYYYNKGEEAVATFDLNPSSFDIAGAEWSLAGMTKLNVKAEAEDEDETWEPAFVKASKNEDGKLEVTYSISNPDEMHTRGFLDMWTEDLNLIQLSAKVGDKTITSDWATIVPNVETRVALRFTEAYDNDELEVAAKDALDNDASITNWAYNSGALDLAKVIEITTTINGFLPSTYSIKEFQTKYPGFKYQFELVPYTDGTNNTQEDKYGVIEGTEFTPCYVDAAGNSKKIAKGADEGSSAIGRKPIVLVTLNEPNGNVVAHGFFKIEIAREAPSVTEIAVKDFGKLPFLCSTTLTTKWSEFSASVLEALHTDYAQFHQNFKLRIVNGACETTADDGNARLYVKNADGTYNIALDEKNDPVSFGSMTFKMDASGNGVNDKFTWEFEKDAAANIDKYQNLYVRFESNNNSFVYLKFSADIAEPLEITYGEINPSYWFDDVEAGVDNTVRANVKVPANSTETLTSFEKDLDDYFIGNAVKIKLDPSSDEVYAPYFDGKSDNGNVKDLKTDYSYQFSSNQPSINGKQLFTNEYNASSSDYPSSSVERCSVLYLGEYGDDGTLKTVNINVDGKTIKVAKYSEDYKIATIARTGDNKGKVTYYKPASDKDTWKASELLNLWGASETDAAKMLYANVDIIYAAKHDVGDACDVAKDTSNFHVRFLRPLSVKQPADTVKLKDAVPGGDYLYLGTLVNAVDWNKNGAASMWTFHAKGTKPNGRSTGLTEDTFLPACEVIGNGATILWAHYYDIKSIDVDESNIQTDQTGSWKKLSEVNGSAKAYVAKANATAWEEHGDAVEISTYDYDKDIQELTNYCFVYENNQGVAHDFHLKVPVKIKYAFGTLVEDVLIKVKGTETK